MGNGADIGGPQRTSVLPQRSGSPQALPPTPTLSVAAQSPTQTGVPQAQTNGMQPQPRLDSAPWVKPQGMNMNSYAKGGSVNAKAKGIASLGRGSDTMLVHMAPREVMALQQLAQQNGTTLTRNPHTGLIEIGNLQSILPMIAGALAAGAVTYFSGGTGAGLSPGIYGAIAGGATNAATDKSNMSTLAKFGTGALAGYGGAGIGNAVAGMGASAAGAAGTGAATAAAPSAASTALPEGYTEATNVASASGVPSAASTAAPAATSAAETPAASSYANLTGHTFGQNMSNMGGGIKSLASHPSTALDRLGKAGLTRYTALQVAAPAIGASMNPDTSGIPTKSKVRYWNTGFDPSTGQYSNGNWSDSYPGYASGGNVDPQKYHADMVTMTPAETAGYVQAFNQGAQTPAYMRDPNSYYNPNRAPMLQVQPAPSATSAAPHQNTSTWAKIAALDSPSHKWILNKLGFGLAEGGIVGYGSGGQTQGPGDGMSDSIPATINGQQPARLAQGEFVVPADVVSHLGNGSTEAGSKQLYAMLDRVRQARTGHKKQGKQINPSKFLP